MAVVTDAITQTLKMKIDDGANFKLARDYGRVKIDQQNPGSTYNLQFIGNVAENLDMGDLTTPGAFVMRNQEAAGGAYIRVGVDSGGFVGFLQLPAMALASGFLDQTDAAQLKAICEDSAGAWLEYWILEY